jgi:hypothetical protein
MDSATVFVECGGFSKIGNPCEVTSYNISRTRVCGWVGGVRASVPMCARARARSIRICTGREVI